MGNILIEKFKEKYTDVVEISFKIFDTQLIGYKSFYKQEAISSIMYNPVTGYYECWIDESKLSSKNEKMIEYFLELD
tara:strand:- start:150 stop:380 length:231 start_codon:yes stop_codon:yes gene_type:complete